MDQRRTGMVALLLAVLALLAVPRLVSPGVTGQPGVAPLPEPPAVGSCLRDLIDRYTEVSCDDPHDVEVSARWAADDPRRAREANAENCEGIGARYTPTGEAPVLARWSAHSAVITVLVQAPPHQRLGARGWSICVVAPASLQQYTGSLRGVSSTTDWADVVGLCFADWRLMQSVPCSSAHTAESLGSTIGSYQKPKVDADVVPASVLTDLTGQCTTVAAQLTGAADPTYGGRLRVVVLADMLQGQRDSVSPTYYAARCVLGAGGGMLVHSLLGWGDRRPPPID